MLDIVTSTQWLSEGRWLPPPGAKIDSAPPNQIIVLVHHDYPGRRERFAHETRGVGVCLGHIGVHGEAKKFGAF